MTDLRAAILKVRAGYESQMKFCDIEALGYFREFVRRLDEALNTSNKIDLESEDYLIAAWLTGAPNAAIERGFPRGFWPDVARTAVELALAGRLDAPLSFRPTRCGPSSLYEEGRTIFPGQTVKGIDVSKLEFKL